MKISLKARGLIIIPLLTIFIGVAEYGAYIQVVALATLMANICSLRLDSGYVRYVYEADDPEGLYTSLVLLTSTIGLIGGILFALLAGPLAEFTLQDGQFSTLFVLGGLLIFVKCLFRIGRGYFQANQKIKIYSILEAIDVYLSISAIGVAILFYDAWIVGALAAYLISHSIIVVIVFVLIGYYGGYSRPTTQSLYGCLHFSVGSMGYLVSQSLLDKVDRVLLGFFIGASAVGIYSAAYSVAYIILLYFRPLSISFFPEFSALWENNDYDEIRSYTITGIRFATIFGLPSIAGFWLVGDSLLNIISTASVANSGVIPLVLIAIAMYAKGIGELYSQLFFASNDSRTPAIVQIGAVLINIILNVLLIPVIGIIGAALTTIVSFTFAALALSIAIRNHIQIKFPAGVLYKPVIASLVMTTILLVLEWNWIVTVSVAPVIYFTVLLFIGGIRSYELNFLMNKVL